MRCPDCGSEYVDARLHARTHAAADEWLDRLDVRVSDRAQESERGRAHGRRNEASA